MCYDYIGDNMEELELQLIPISEIKKEDNIQLIPLKKVEYLAFIATTLTPLDAFLEIDGYTNALWEYMQEKKYQDQELFFYYDKLIHANMGHAMLSNLIALLLIEKEIRNHGFTTTLDRQYQKLQNEYRFLLQELRKESS